MAEDLDSRANYRIVLATPFEEFEAEVSRYQLYEDIAGRLEGRGFKTFLPHRDIKPDWPNERVFREPNNRIIPNSEWVIADIGVREDGKGSTAAGIMIGSALQFNIPLIQFYEKDKRAKDVFPEDMEIEYRAGKDLLEKIEAYVLH